MKSLIIGLGSTARIGKDFATIELAKHFDVERVAFADEVKLDVAKMVSASGLDYYELEKDPVQKELLRPLLVAHAETMKKFKQTIWIERAFNGRKLTHDITVIPDVRFPFEVEWIHSQGGIYIEIETDKRPINEVEALNHPLMVKLADYTVRNNFDSKFVRDLVQLVSEVSLCKTPSNKSNITSSTEESISSSTKIPKPWFHRRFLKR